jgi:YD repeat-containing protein
MFFKKLTMCTIVQEELGIEPKLDGYDITVNISDPNEENQYVVIGDEKDPNGIQYPWSLLNPETQRGLLAWTGQNKTIHNVKMEFIETIEYRNDNSGNRLSKKVYNTAGDVISNERYTYNSSGKLLERTKYNSKGKVMSKESYTYDDGGNLTAVSSGTGKTEYKFNDGEKMIERISYSGKNMTGKDVYTYDLTGNIESITGYDASDSVHMKVSNQYNENGLMREIQYYDSGGMKTKIVRYQYEFYY